MGTKFPVKMVSPSPLHPNIPNLLPIPNHLRYDSIPTQFISIPTDIVVKKYHLTNDSLKQFIIKTINCKCSDRSIKAGLAELHKS